MHHGRRVKAKLKKFREKIVKGQFGEITDSIISTVVINV